MMGVTPVLAVAGRDQEPVPVPPPVDVTTAPTASPTAPASPSTVPSAGGTPVPDGRISATALGNAILEIPSWPTGLATACPSGWVRFRDGRARLAADADLAVVIEKVVHLDIDRDGAVETATLIRCAGLEVNGTKVLVFDRNASGAIVTVGQVVDNSGNIAGIRTIRPAGPAVEVEVVDYSGDGLPDGFAQRQWRSYSWFDGRFRQSGGATRFPANPYVTDLALGGMDPRLHPAGTDQYSGTFTLIVNNKGPQPATAPYVTLRLPAFVTVTPPPGCRNPTFDRGVFVCPMDRIEARGSGVLKIVLTVDRSAVGTGVVGTFTSTAAWGPTLTAPPYPEPAGKEMNNRLTRNIIVSG